MKLPKAILIGLCILLFLISGCSARTPQGSCMDDCKDTFRCVWLDDSDIIEECKVQCFNECYDKNTTSPNED